MRGCPMMPSPVANSVGARGERKAPYQMGRKPSLRRTRSFRRSRCGRDRRRVALRAEPAAEEMGKRDGLPRGAGEDVSKQRLTDAMADEAQERWPDPGRGRDRLVGAAPSAQEGHSPHPARCPRGCRGGRDPFRIHTLNGEGKLVSAPRRMTRKISRTRVGAGLTVLARRESVEAPDSAVRGDSRGLDGRVSLRRRTDVNRRPRWRPFMIRGHSGMGAWGEV